MLNARWFVAARLFASMAVLGTSNVAIGDAYVPAGTHVTTIATSELYRQQAVIFKLDQTVNDYCTAGSWVNYYGINADDLKIAYETILGAYIHGKPVIVHFPTPHSCVTDGIGIGSY